MPHALFMHLGIGHLGFRFMNLGGKDSLIRG
jgi:hypothetical protein